ncbi:MAG TPA: FHA domain-containing protein [Thermodesulfobacteriota bacterium]|nr:FHA domain-containing protein [Thermodesulfobacteriota bacterium]
MDSPFIIVTLGSKIIGKRRLDQEIITIGRTPENDIVIDNLTVSSNHAIIYKKDDKVFVKDTESESGTFVNGLRISETEFGNGDAIMIGKHIIKFYYEEDYKFEEGFNLQGDGDTTLVDVKIQEEFLRNLVGEYGASRLILSNGREIEINGELFTIGSGDNSSLKIDGVFIKNPHARIIKGADGTHRIISTGSLFRPTRVNGVKVKEKRPSR